jgi:hypothetical protein
LERRGIGSSAIGYTVPTWYGYAGWGCLDFFVEQPGRFTLAEASARLYTFTIRPGRGTKTFEPINTNGSQRGWRPIIHVLPHRVRDVKILEGADLHPLITDNFILVPNPRKCDAERAYRVRFQAAKVE